MIRIADVKICAHCRNSETREEDKLYSRSYCSHCLKNLATNMAVNSIIFSFFQDVPVHCKMDFLDGNLILSEAAHDIPVKKKGLTVF